MKNSRLLILAIGIISFSSFSQDFIVKKNGDEIKSKVIEVGTSEVKYRKFESPTGPIYVIKKVDIFMIKYEDGTKDVFSNEQMEKPAEKVADKAVKETLNEPSSSGKYIDKVREIQKNDPSFGLYLGNGFLNGNGYSNPVLGIDIKMSRKNVWLRGLSVGFRAGFKNAVFYGDYSSYQEMYGFALTAKYHAPLPIKVVQPYFITHFGVAYQNTYAFLGQYTDSGYKMEDLVSSGLVPFLGFGLGSNFMVAKHFGFFVEAGYFSASLINFGLHFKF
jgi:hypothetical protein